MREAQAASMLNHPNIVTIYDIATEDGVDFMVMEYVDGLPLSQLIPRRGLRLRDTLDYAEQIADGVATAHAAGIVHRDLKPSNVVVTSLGRVKILDFGIAKLRLLESEADTAATQSELTMAGAVLGTVAYMAPEQAMAQPVDHRADIFSFGVMLYEMVTGARPFRGTNPLQIFEEILAGPPTRLRTQCPEAPEILERLVERALSRDLDARPQSMTEVREVLRQAGQAATDQPWGDGKHSPAAGGAPRSELPTLHTHPPSAGGARTSIAVLPFTSLSNSEEDGHLAAGIASEIISALSGVPNLSVASHLASFQFQGQNPDLDQVAETLGIRYVLTGILRRAGNRIRVIAELTDAIPKTQLWSATYDRDLEDLFAVQEEIAKDIVSATGGELIRAGAELASHSPPESLDAFGLVQKAYHFWNAAFNREGVEDAMNLLRRAVSLDPGYAAAHAFLGLYLIQRVVNAFSEDLEKDRAEALAAVKRATELAPREPTVLENAGLVWFNCGEHEKSVQTLRRCVTLAPFDLVAWGYLGLSLGWAGDLDEAHEAVRILDHLLVDTPNHPSVPYWLSFKINACATVGDLEAAEDAARRSIALQPLYSLSQIAHANILGLMGRCDEARQAMDGALAINPGVTAAVYRSEMLVITGSDARATCQLAGLDAAGIR